jgi:hypothetical protein
MGVIRYTTAREFVARTRLFLENAEAENNLILGISRFFTTTSVTAKLNPYFLAIEAGGILVGAALIVPPRNLIVSRMPESALSGLTGYLLRESIYVPGVVGPKDTTRLFADLWQNQTGKNFFVKMNQRIYACRRVLIQTYAQGYLRSAIESDQSLALQWAAEFCRDAGIPDEIEFMSGRIPNLIATGSLYLWEDDQAVSSACIQRETAHGIAISMVYTPTHFRNRGYATSCVAAVTQRMLDSGKTFCCLYTDVTNPASNSIYQKIGYQPICDSQDLVFV